jgi:hypothetical protein
VTKPMQGACKKPNTRQRRTREAADAAMEEQAWEYSEGREREAGLARDDARLHGGSHRRQDEGEGLWAMSH